MTAFQNDRHFVKPFETVGSSNNARLLKFGLIRLKKDLDHFLVKYLATSGNLEKKDGWNTSMVRGRKRVTDLE